VHPPLHVDARKEHAVLMPPVVVAPQQVLLRQVLHQMTVEHLHEASAEGILRRHKRRKPRERNVRRSNPPRLSRKTRKTRKTRRTRKTRKTGNTRKTRRTSTPRKIPLPHSKCPAQQLARPPKVHPLLRHHIVNHAAAPPAGKAVAAVLAARLVERQRRVLVVVPRTVCHQPHPAPAQVAAPTLHHPMHRNGTKPLNIIFFRCHIYIHFVLNVLFLPKSGSFEGGLREV